MAFLGNNLSFKGHGGNHKNWRNMMVSKPVTPGIFTGDLRNLPKVKSWQRGDPITVRPTMRDGYAIKAGGVPARQDMMMIASSTAPVPGQGPGYAPSLSPRAGTGWYTKDEAVKVYKQKQKYAGEPVRGLYTSDAGYDTFMKKQLSPTGTFGVWIPPEKRPVGKSRPMPEYAGAWDKWGFPPKGGQWARAESGEWIEVEPGLEVAISRARKQSYGGYISEMAREKRGAWEERPMSRADYGEITPRTFDKSFGFRQLMPFKVPGERDPVIAADASPFDRPMVPEMSRRPGLLMANEVPTEIDMVETVQGRRMRPRASQARMPGGIAEFLQNLFAGIFGRRPKVASEEVSPWVQELGPVPMLPGF